MTSPSGLWAEGDSLTPTNLNSRNPVGNFPSRTYHVAWAAGSGTTQINNAIANAVAGGYSYLFIDKSRLPFNASLVSFNNNLLMLCEGGRTDAVDIRAYGASAAGNQDDQPAIQAAFDVVNNATTTTRFPAEVFIPPTGARYNLGKPLWMKKGFRVFGQSGIQSGAASRSLLLPTYGAGPTILVANSSDTIPTTTALLTGTGSALQLTDDTRWFNLRDCASLDLNGLSAFAVEATVNATSVAGNKVVVTSNGRFLSSDTLHACFKLAVNAGVPSFILNLSGGTVTLNGGALTTGTTTHLAGTYDGTTVRLFVGGALAASALGSGTLVQDPSEDVIVGPALSVTPDGQTVTSVLPGTFDSIRVSNVARYTAAFTAPTAKFTTDANTLALMNFDTQTGPLTRVDTTSGVFWAFMRDQNNGGGVAGFSFENLDFSAPVTGTTSGIFIGRFSPDGHFHKLNFNDQRIGIAYFAGDSYEWEMDHLFFSGGNSACRYGIQLVGNPGIASLRRVDFIGAFTVPILAVPSGIHFDGVFIESSTAMVFGMLLKNVNVDSRYNLTNVTISTENGVPSSFRAPLCFSGAGATISGGAIESSGTYPHIIADSVVALEAIAPVFTTGTTAPGVVAITGTAPTLPIVFRSPKQRSGWVPWSNTTGGVFVDIPGVLSSTSTGGTLLFNASLYGQWDLTLTSDATQSSWTRISYGQPVSGAIKMDSTGSRLFVWPTNSKGTVTLSYGSAAVNTFTGFYDGVNVILTSVRTGL